MKSDEFISEDDLQTFERWLKYQAVDATTMSPEDLVMWRQSFEETREQGVPPKLRLMKLQQVPGEYRYAVAVKDGSNLWLVLWVKRNKKGEFFIMLPRGDKDWDPHTSYHLDGTLHMKTYGRTVLPQKRQPLTKAFHGIEHLGIYASHGPKTFGAVCDPTAFSGVVEVPPGVLGPRHGEVAVDLVEPGHDAMELRWTQIVVQQIFRDMVPWVVITVRSSG